jgi:formiminotetrahydrofolate cyclodeaminase
MEDQPTCGKGLAERSTLPAALGALSAAMADNLERHKQALDLTDDNARSEHEAYELLAKEYRDIASRLQAAADRMVGYRDLPMGRHDARALEAREIRDAFVNFVERERALVALLKTWIEHDQMMLGEIHSTR